MLITHESYDVFLLFLDDRLTNGKTSAQRFGALDQFVKLTNYKKARNFYLTLNCFRYYKYFDRFSQIIGTELFEVYACRDKLVNSLEILKSKYGEYESFFYISMIDGDEIYEYQLNHTDNVHLQIIANAKARPSKYDENENRYLIITEQDKRDCNWLSFRNDVIEMYIKKIKDRCFNHVIAKFIIKFDPQFWNVKILILTESAFLLEYLNDEIDAIVKYWPQIDQTSAKIGCNIVKRLYLNVFRDDDKLTLMTFGTYIIKRYQYDSTMFAISQIYGSILGILPSATVLENWNSIATAVWSDLRKRLIPQSIHEVSNVKINGPPTAEYDPRIVAGKLAKASHNYPVDVTKHKEQKYLASFFHTMNVSRDQQLKDIEKINKVTMRTIKIRDIRSLKTSLNHSNFNTSSTHSNNRQSNLTEYWFRSTNYGNLNYQLIAIIISFAPETMTKSLKLLSKSFLNGYNWFILSTPIGFSFEEARIYQIRSKDSCRKVLSMSTKSYIYISFATSSNDVCEDSEIADIESEDSEDDDTPVCEIIRSMCV